MGSYASWLRTIPFDVLVTENLFGDILSDEASVLQATHGVIRFPLSKWSQSYEPIHGRPLILPGKGIANPVSMILSGQAMMLESPFSQRRGCTHWAGSGCGLTRRGINSRFRRKGFGCKKWRKPSSRTYDKTANIELCLLLWNLLSFGLWFGQGQGPEGALPVPEKVLLGDVALALGGLGSRICRLLFPPQDPKIGISNWPGCWESAWSWAALHDLEVLNGRTIDFDKLWDRHVVTGTLGQPSSCMWTSIISMGDQSQAFQGPQSKWSPGPQTRFDLEPLTHNISDGGYFDIRMPFPRLRWTNWLKMSFRFGVTMHRVQKNRALFTWLAQKQAGPNLGNSSSVVIAIRPPMGPFGALAFGSGTSEVGACFATPDHLAGQTKETLDSALLAVRQKASMPRTIFCPYCPARVALGVGYRLNW